MNDPHKINSILVVAALAVGLGARIHCASADVVLDMPAPPKLAAASTDRSQKRTDVDDESAAYAAKVEVIDPGDLAFARYTRGRYYPTSYYGPTRFGRYGYQSHEPWWDVWWWSGGWGGWGWPWFGCGPFIGVGTVETIRVGAPVNNISHSRHWTQVRHFR